MKPFPYLFTSIYCLLVLITPGWASIQIEDADASLEIGLVGVSVPTQSVPIIHLFIAHEDAVTHSDLQFPNIPTRRLPIRRIYTSNEDAAIVTHLVFPGQPVNRSPQFLGLTGQVIQIGNTLSLQLHATDADGDPLTFSTADLPTGARMSGDTFTWTPSEDQMGSHTLNFTVSDGRGGTDSMILSITVENQPNQQRGDVNGDGKIDFGDAIKVLQFYVDLITLTTAQQQVGDVDRSGTTDFKDATLILQLYTGIIDQNYLIENFPKLLVISETPRPLSLRLEGVEWLEEERYLHLVSEPIEGIIGGEFLLTWGIESDAAVDIILEQLSPSAVCVVNDRNPGQLRLTFIDLESASDRQPLRLRVGLRNDAAGSSIPLCVDGQLYDRQGIPSWTVHFAQSIDGKLPATFSLGSNYPNPFNPSTVIPFELPQTGRITLQIYTLTGQRVRTLVDDSIAVGSHSVEWDGRDERGNLVGSGVYLYRLSVDDSRFSVSRRMILIK